MNVNQQILYLSCEFEVAAVHDNDTVTIKNMATKLRQDDIVVKSRYVRLYNG